MRLILIFLFSCSMFGCWNNNEPLREERSIGTKELSTIKKQFNKVEVGYYVNLKKSPIAVVKDPDDGAKSWLQFVNFIREAKVQDTCKLNFANNIPDGHLVILKDSVTLLHLEFVLKGDCQGFYSDFSDNPKKYDISPEGVLQLTKLMEATKKNYH